MIFDLRLTISKPSERGLQPASAPKWLATLKRHECRAPQIFNRVIRFATFPNRKS
jgi:hypothetical protein